MNDFLLIPYDPSISGLRPEIPILFQVDDIPGEDFVPFFTSEEKLHESMEHCGRKHYIIKQVDDVEESVTSIREQGIRVMLDPHLIDEKLRWTELCLEEEYEEYTRKPEVRKSSGEAKY